jgi:hypothetical protein
MQRSVPAVGFYSYCRADLYQRVVSVRAIGGSGKQRSNNSLRTVTRRFCRIAAAVRLAGIHRGEFCALSPPLRECRALARKGLEHKGREGLLPILHRQRRLYRASFRQLR